MKAFCEPCRNTDQKSTLSAGKEFREIEATAKGQWTRKPPLHTSRMVELNGIRKR